MLAVHGLSVSFGGVQALDEATLDVTDGEIVGLIGPNGAGKTTLFNCISRLYTPTRGSITLDGVDLLALPAHRLAAAGVARTFQNVGLVHRLDVLGNVLLGAHHTVRSGFGRSILRPVATRREERELRERAFHALDLLDLTAVAGADIRELPYGTLKRIELARAVLARPRVMLLDEPANGLAHGEVDDLAALITRLRAELDLAVLLVEHHMGLVAAVCHRVVALVGGRVVTSGTPAEVRSHPEVVAAYLGTRAAA